MSSLDDPAIKSKYKKCKFRVKCWESDFMEKHGRRPNKNDIRSADTSIKEAYKMYWKLKTQALEETLLDITFSDDVKSNVSVNVPFDKLSSNEDVENIANKNIIFSPPKNIENIVPESSRLKIIQTNSIVVSPLEKNSVNIDGAWGEHLNKDNVAPKKKRLTISKSSSFQLSQSKFSASTFSKRNPRKSLSMSRIKSKLDLNKLETETGCVSESKPIETINTVKSFLGNTVKIVQEDTKILAQPINPIQQLINGCSNVAERNVDVGWLERCSKENNLGSFTTNQRLSGISDSGVESMDSRNHTPLEITSDSVKNSAEISDDDDFVCNSDTEEERKSKRIRNWRKSLSDMANLPAKRLCVRSTSEIVSSSLNDNLSANITTAFNNKNNSHTTNIIRNIQKEAFPSKDAQEAEIVNAETNEQMIIKITTVKSKVDSSHEEIEKPKVKRTRTARVVRSKPVTRSKRISSTTYTKDRAPVKRVRRRTTRNKIPNEDAETTSEENEGPETRIYSVESLKVVPRFAVPADTNGNLIDEFSQFIEVHEPSVTKTATKPKSTMTAKEKLEAKVAAGKVNENFVRINLKKKVFTRGKKSFNLSKFKRNEWKQKKKDLISSEGSLDLADLAEKNTCFKCGSNNHISKKCPALKSDELLPLEGYKLSNYPTLEEAEKMAKQKTMIVHAHQIDEPSKCPIIASQIEKHDNNIEVKNEDTLIGDVNFNEEFDVIEKKSIVGHKIPQDLVDKLLPPINGKIEPLYPSSDDGLPFETPSEVFEALKMFGHDNFRPGQEKAVMRILTGQSTLVTLSTSSGKSLCYQLPAYLYAKKFHCITLVVSPLVSLMDDQVTGIPGFISAAALHTGQSPKVREKILETVKNGELDILLVSPEAVVAGEKSTSFGSLLRQLPPIAFVCIDEAHCISQWSHNFRPSYLMICRVLIEKMGVKTILGLTATATMSTAESIVSHLRIHDGMHGVISDIPMPKNLVLTVSKDDQRDQALTSLLKSKRFEQCDSIIIYCTRREECTRIAGLLRISLQNAADLTKPKSKAKVSPIAEAYHAGLLAGRRKVIQKAFMKGDIRIVVATVAFGMGINKSNIRSVIHYNMPSNFESYVQEVGRAGRDNLPAQCHLFISHKEDSDKWELRRHIYKDGVDRHTIRRLLQKIFVACSCAANGRKCPGHEVAIPINETVRALDVSEETISTLLCYLELHPKKFVTVLSSVYVNAKVTSYNGPEALKMAAQSSPPLAMAFALDKKKGIDHENSSIIEFPVIDVAAAIGWDSGIVKNHLKNLEWKNAGGKYHRTSISVRYDTLGLRVRAPGDLTNSELDEALDALAERSRSQQTSALQQLEAIHASLNQYSHSSVRDCMELNEESMQKSESLKSVIRQYFQSSSPPSIIDVPIEVSNKTNEEQVVNDIRSLICNYKDNNFTGRAIARIFHGISSPNYSALTWSRCRFWRAHLSTDFNWIVQIATREILSMR